MTTTTMPPAESPERTLLDVRAVARLLDCSTRHVHRLRDGGVMPQPVRLGALIRWRRSDLDAWVAGVPPVPCGREGPVMTDYLDRDALILLGIDGHDADELLRRSGLTGHGSRPVLEADRLHDMLTMLRRDRREGCP